MESASRKLSKYQSSLPVLPTVVISLVMVTLLALCTLTDPAAGKQPPRAGTLHGTTSQGLPVLVKTSYGGALIQKASIPIEVHCPDGSFVVPESYRMVRITRSGRFKESSEGSDLDEGVAFRVVLSFAGRFNRQRSRVVAKSRIYITAHNPDGTVETCDSGVVTIRAHR